jgi:restriction system protein
MYDWATKEVRACQACGWWNLEAYSSGTTPVLGANFDCEYSETRYAHGTLRNLDVADIRTPLSELERYLVARWDRVGEVHPKLVEQTVGAVFRNAGFQVDITACSGDGGIDIVLLYGPGSQRIGVQVKRNKQRIEAEQLRAFVAALLLKDMKYGYFVATGSFRTGATSIVRLATQKDLAYIELRDGAWLLEELRVRQRPCYTAIRDFNAPWLVLLDDLASVPCVNQSSTARDAPWPGL